MGNKNSTQPTPGPTSSATTRNYTQVTHEHQQRLSYYSNNSNAQLVQPSLMEIKLFDNNVDAKSGDHFSWKCQWCTLINAGTRNRCDVCFRSRSNVEDAVFITSSKSVSAIQGKSSIIAKASSTYTTTTGTLNVATPISAAGYNVSATQTLSPSQHIVSPNQNSQRGGYSSATHHLSSSGQTSGASQHTASSNQSVASPISAGYSSATHHLSSSGQTPNASQHTASSYRSGVYIVFVYCRF
jgi:hypothetical protein